jgi:hypothetical protein
MQNRQSENNSTTTPMLGTWSGTGSGKPLYVGINTCNIFIDMIDGVEDMEANEKADWKAQALFLKAYYHFMLLQQYGPIVIMDKAVSPEDDPSSLYASRSKIDACFDYIVRTLDKAIPDLLLRKTGSDLGQIDKLGATAIKARVLFYSASPFYSGNEDYTDFQDHDGQLFFPQDDAATKKAKWEKALVAINDAITLCENNGLELYKYTNKMLPDDLEDAKENPKMQTLYDLRMLICDQWNKELIWGCSNVFPTDNDLFSDGNIILPIGYTGQQTRSYCTNYLGATYRNLERYYTANGLPLDEDNTFDRSSMYDVAYTPAPADPEYSETRGILQPNAETINLYLNRELRFYANVGITGGYWRAFGNRISTTFYANGPAGRFPPGSYNAYYFWSAIGAQKVVHIESRGVSSRDVVTYPTPIIRLADLYLMKAEALNESLDAPTQEVWNAIDKVRRRAGIPNVEDAYTGAYVTGKALNKHIQKTGMRDIIAHERKVEFAFEGQIFWDMIRTRKAPEEFSTPAMGWSANGSDAEGFFKLQLLQIRTFTLRDCLWPIDLDELTRNVNLIQNPGW